MLRRFVKGHRGASAVEFAFVLPLLFASAFASIDFGRYYFVSHALQFATREGVRLATAGGVPDDPAARPLTRIASIVKMVRDKASLAVDPSEIVISVFPIQGDYSDPPDWSGRQDPGGPGDYMRVRTVYTYRFMTSVIGELLSGGTGTVKGEATYRNAGGGFPPK